MEKSPLKSVVKKFLDKRTGHNRKDYKSMKLKQLQKEHTEILDFYNGPYQDMLKVVISKEKIYTSFL